MQLILDCKTIKEPMQLPVNSCQQAWARVAGDAFLSARRLLKSFHSCGLIPSPS